MIRLALIVSAQSQSALKLEINVMMLSSLPLAYFPNKLLADDVSGAGGL